MRILFLNPIGALGGGERSLLDVFATLRALEPSWELRLIVGADGALIEKARRLGMDAELLPMPEELLVLGDASSGLGLLKRAGSAWLGARRYARELGKRVAALKPDLIHSNGMKFHLLTRMIGRVRAPIVWHIRDFISSRKLMRHALRWAAPAAAVAIANSQATAADARKVMGRVPVRAVLNGIDVVHFSPGPGRSEWLDELAGMGALRQTGMSAPLLRVGLLGSYARWKGQDIFLRAAKEVSAECRVPSAEKKVASAGKNVRFFVVGGEIYKTRGSQFSLEELKGLARELGIEERVGFVPFQQEPRNVYRALDVVVHASTQPEPFGRTIAEGMACGRAVIAASAGGAVELFTPEEDAIGVAPGDVGGLAAAISRLSNDDALRARLGERARATAVERFSLERMGRELVGIYREVLSTE